MNTKNLNNKINTILHRYIAFGGLTKRKTTEGEVILKGDLDKISNDLTEAVFRYIEELTLEQIKDFIKRLVSNGS